MADQGITQIRKLAMDIGLYNAVRALFLAHKIDLATVEFTNAELIDLLSRSDHDSEFGRLLFEKAFQQSDMTVATWQNIYMYHPKSGGKALADLQRIVKEMVRVARSDYAWAIVWTCSTEESEERALAEKKLTQESSSFEDWRKRYLAPLPTECNPLTMFYWKKMEQTAMTFSDLKDLLGYRMYINSRGGSIGNEDALCKRTLMAAASFEECISIIPTEHHNQISRDTLQAICEKAESLAKTFADWEKLYFYMEGMGPAGRFRNPSPTMLEGMLNTAQTLNEWSVLNSLTARSGSLRPIRIAATLRIVELGQTLEEIAQAFYSFHHETVARAIANRLPSLPPATLEQWHTVAEAHTAYPDTHDFILQQIGERF